MKFGRTAALCAALAAGAFTVTSCQPAPPAPSPLRGLRFDITVPGPLVIGADVDGNPIALTDTPPLLEAGSTVDGCDPISQVDEWNLVRQPWTAPDGTVYDSWGVTGGSYTVIVPSAAKCIPTKNEDATYLVVGIAETLNDDGPLVGAAIGGAVDEQVVGDIAPFTPRFKVVK
jgi:hypothetical protein